MIELYEFALSGNCHKVRLMLGMLGIDYQSRVIDGAAREQKSASFLELNPFGQVPVLKDGDVIIRDSQAILVYLARQYGNESWYPSEAVTAAQISAWLSTATNDVMRGLAALRAHHKMGRAINVPEAQANADALLKILELHLTSREYLVTPAPTIADIAMYPYVALAPEGKVDPSRFVNIRNWLKNIEQLPGYVSMPGIMRQ
ncbi:MAG: glutathione S-transferase family protein [Spirochaetes bacterium]|nr:glutathione S-transferase family protein [Spirochaetota bacterium]